MPKESVSLDRKIDKALTKLSEDTSDLAGQPLPDEDEFGWTGIVIVAFAGDSTEEVGEANNIEEVRKICAEGLHLSPDETNELITQRILYRSPRTGDDGEIEECGYELMDY